MHPFVEGLQKAGNEIVVLTPYHTDLKIKDFSYRIISYKYIWPYFLHRLGYSQTLTEGTKFKLETYLLAPFLYLFGCIALIRLLRKERFDIISAHWILPNGLIAYIASRFIKIPYTISLAGSDVYVANKNWLFSFMARLCANSASFICADSPQYIKELKKTGVRPNRLHVMPYPVDTSKLEVNSLGVFRFREKLRISKNAVVVLAVGRLIQKKGYRYLLEAFSNVVKNYKNVSLIIVGEGDLRKKLERIIADLYIEQFVRLVGNVERDKIVFYYNMADIFVMSSIKDEEGNIDDRPVALLEAIACGKPAIATNFPGNALSIKDSVSGFLVPEKNVSAMSSAILRLIKSDSLRKKMSRSAKKIAYEQFDMVQVGRKNTELFKSVLKNA